MGVEFKATTKLNGSDNKARRGRKALRATVSFIRIIWSFYASEIKDLVVQSEPTEALRRGSFG